MGFKFKHDEQLISVKVPFAKLVVWLKDSEK